MFSNHLCLKHFIAVIAMTLILAIDCHSANRAVAASSEELKAFFKGKGNLTTEDILMNGMRCISESKPDSALAYYSIALGRIDTGNSDTDIKTLGSLYNNIGYIYLYEYNDCVQAYDYFLKALETQEKTDDKELKPYILLNIGNVYAMFNDQSTAIDTYKKAFSSVDLNGTNSGIASVIALNLFPDAYVEHRVDEVLQEIDIFLNAPHKDDRLYDVASLVAMGIKKGNEGKHGLESEFFEKAIETYEQDSAADRRIRASLQLMTAESLNRSGDINNSILMLRKILKSTKEDGMFDLASVAAYNMSEYFKDAGMTDSADYYRLHNLYLRDSLLNMTNFGKIKDLHSMHNINNANEEIKLLVIKDKNKTNLLVLSVMSALLLIILLSAIIVKNRKLKARNEALFLHAQRLSGEMSTNVAGRDVTQNLKADAPAEKTEFTAKDSAEDSAKDSAESQTSRLIVNDTVKAGLKDDISRILLGEEIYSPDFSLDTLAMLVNSKSRYVSSVINECFGCGFNQLLGETRIKRACQMLANKEYDNLTIQSISESLGFRSRSNFSALFKKFTGLTPGEYHSIAVRKRESDS